MILNRKSTQHTIVLQSQQCKKQFSKVGRPTRSLFKCVLHNFIKTQQSVYSVFHCFRFVNHKYVHKNFALERVEIISNNKTNRTNDTCYTDHLPALPTRQANHSQDGVGIHFRTRANSLPPPCPYKKHIFPYEVFIVSLEQTHEQN